MPTITYTYSVGQAVYAISREDGVQEGVVKQLEITQVFPAIAPTIQYVISLTCGGSVLTTEDKVFADIDSALAGYKLLVQASC